MTPHNKIIQERLGTAALFVDRARESNERSNRAEVDRYLFKVDECIQRAIQQLSINEVHQDDPSNLLSNLRDEFEQLFKKAEAN